MFKILQKLRLNDWLCILLGILFIVGQVYLDLKAPEYTKVITNVITTGQGTMGDIWFNGGLMLICSIGSALLAVATGYLAARIAASFGHNLRSEIFRKVNDLCIEDVKNFSVPSLITRTTNDVFNMQRFISMGFQVLIKAPILAVWTIVKITDTNWQWSAATALSVVTIVIVILILMCISFPRFKRIQKLTDDINNATRENITGVRVVRAYNAEAYEQQKFQKTNRDLARNYLINGNAMSLMEPMMSLVMNVLTLAIYLIGAYLMAQFGLTGSVAGDAANIAARGDIFGDLMVFTSYAINVLMAFVMMTMIFIMLPRSIVSAKRINEVLDTPLTIKDGRGATAETDNRGEIEFKHVSFKYPDAADYIIRNVNLKINQGETVAFIGSTGSGKTTLVNLVPRFYDATEGEVLVDGVNVKDYKITELNNKIGYVPQKALLFSGDIRSNIDFGTDNSGTKDDETIMRAIKVAQAENFVNKTGLEGAVAQGGTNFSGGQKQRLCIARALARDAEFYIFDDSFSALDYKTDQKLRKEIKKITQKNGSTVLMIAQRIGTIKDADKIVVFDAGEIVGIGTHDELSKNCSIYQEILKSQFNKKEAASCQK